VRGFDVSQLTECQRIRDELVSASILAGPDFVNV